MPIHDWTHVTAGIFHHCWISAISDALNTGGLWDGCFALIEQTSRDAMAQQDPYVAKASQITINSADGQVIAVIEIVSPGNKDSRTSLAAFVEKTSGLIRKGIHLLMIDLFPPTHRDPQGIHKAIWDEIREEPFELPPDKPLTLVSYAAGATKTAYVEPVAVGDELPEMPIFLDPETYVPAPLETTYQTTWSVCPEPMRDLLTQAGS